MAALREEISEKDQEIERMRAENASLVQSEAEASLALEKFEKIIIGEINEECTKTADLLGVQPRKAQAVKLVHIVICLVSTILSIRHFAFMRKETYQLLSPLCLISLYISGTNYKQIVFNQTTNSYS